MNGRDTFWGRRAGLSLGRVGGGCLTDGRGEGGGLAGPPSSGLGLLLEMFAGGWEEQGDSGLERGRVQAGERRILEGWHEGIYRWWETGDRRGPP